jgi:hypothetical protein
MNLNDYTNPFTYTSPKDDPQAFDIWANRNDLIQEQFSEDILTYMKTVLSETDFVDTNNVIDKKLQNIVDIITNEKDTYEERFWLAIELLPLVV